MSPRVGGERIRIWEPDTGQVRRLWGSSGRLFTQHGDGSTIHDGQAPLLAVRFDGETEWLTPVSAERGG